MPVPKSDKFGISAAITTPFTSTGAIDIDLLCKHARSLLARGCVSFTLGGTTGEGPHLSRDEKIAAHKALVASGIEPARIIVGVIESALGDAIAAAKAADSLGSKYVLVTPPYYFKGSSDAGQITWFRQFLDAIRDTRLQVILYHIPQVTAAPISPDMIAALIESHPDLIAGVKDSSGDWENAKILLDRFADRHILIGDERILSAAIARGGSGAISGVASFAPELLIPLLNGATPDSRLVPLVNALLELPVTPAIKALVGHMTDDMQWSHVRTPLVELTQEQYEWITNTYDTLFATGND
jgi:4-hydroxy-tetrahydrodipicolinate synthase